jgi:hypothetical protein
MSTILTGVVCHDCKAPVSIVKRTVEVPCKVIYGVVHESDPAWWTPHTHAVPDVAWTVVEANGERHLCASNA